MQGGAIPARAEMWPAATGQHRRCGRRGDRRERGRGRRRASTAGGRGGDGAVGGGAVGGGGAATGRRRRGWLQTARRRRAERKWSARENETARGAGSALKHLISDGYGLGRRT
jgi:hypothetical protein